MHIVTFVLAVAADGFAMQRSQSESFDAALHINDLLWQGMDVSEEDIATTRALFNATRAVAEATPAPGGHRLRVLIAGPFDSGTNLMSELLKRNLPSVYTEVGCPRKFWKHSMSGHLAFLKTLERLRPADGLGPEDTKVIAVLRSPISQVSSWHKAPYDLRQCAARPYDRVEAPCSAQISASLELCNQHRRDDRSWAQFAGTMDVYNKYVRQYWSLASSGRLRGLKIVTYEEMLHDPRRVVQELAGFLGGQAPRNIDICTTPAKQHGMSHGRELALQIYRERQWLREIRETDLLHLCRNLDVGLIGNLTEGKSFMNEQGRKPLPYSHDCREVSA